MSCYILFFLIICYGIRINIKGINTNYLSHESTNAIKGVFILLVFISHIIPYITKGGYEYIAIGDSVFRHLSGYIGQWVVAMFLFYSGYGIMEAITHKGNSYIETFPKKRILSVLLNFDIAVLIFIITQTLLGHYVPASDYLLSFIAWSSVGNSNWYIFVILLCYLFVYMSFRVTNKVWLQWLLFILLTLLSFKLLSLIKPIWWYDTMLCFAFGMLFSKNKDRIFQFVSKYYTVLLAVLTLVLIPAYKYSYFFGGYSYNVFSIIFCCWIIILSMKVDISSNSLLKWCGKNLFPLYIYQRIPMIVLSSIAGGILPSTYPVIYIFTCLFVTVVITYLYKYWMVKF